MLATLLKERSDIIFNMWVGSVFNLIFVEQIPKVRGVVQSFECR